MSNVKLAKTIKDIKLLQDTVLIWENLYIPKDIDMTYLSNIRIANLKRVGILKLNIDNPKQIAKSKSVCPLCNAYLTPHGNCNSCPLVELDPKYECSKMCSPYMKSLEERSKDVMIQALNDSLANTIKNSPKRILGKLKAGELGDITLTEQEIFEYSYAHLMLQKEKSVDDIDNCMYEGEGGLCCAAAPFLIQWFEEEPMSERFLIEDNKHLCLFITYLQEIHDYEPIKDWEFKLEELAKERKLIVPKFIKSINMYISEIKP